MKDNILQVLNAVRDFDHPIEIQILGNLSDPVFDNERPQRASAKQIGDTFALCSKFFALESKDLPETAEVARRWADGIVSLVSRQTFSYRLGILHIGCGRIFSFTANSQDLISTGAALTAPLSVGKHLQGLLPEDAANIPTGMFTVGPFYNLKCLSPSSFWFCSGFRVGFRTCIASHKDERTSGF